METTPLQGTLTPEEVYEFQEHIWEQAKRLYRPMPWREDPTPYRVLVSEIMLQQTQVDRVLPKFLAFMERFPTLEVLAESPLADVLLLWNGLGYNRRAKFLHEAAKKLCEEHGGTFPRTVKELTSLPGVGVNTAGALLAYSFNIPQVFIETNIRTVYFFHFFQDTDVIDDVTVRHYVTQTIDREHPREWYWALMDYGTHLKKQGLGFNSKSRHYKKQAPLRGSIREVRGQILKLLTSMETKSVPYSLLEDTYIDDERFKRAYDGLVDDGLIVLRHDNTVHLAS